MTDLSPLAFATVALIVTIAYTVYGVTGFGAAIVGLPFLAHYFPLRFAVPMLLVFDLAAGLLLGLGNRRQVERRELIRLLPFVVVGMGVGITALVRAPERWLLLGLGTFVLGYALWSLAAKGPPASISPRWSIPAGLVGGSFTALYGTGGPIYTIYLARRIADKSALRATTGVLILSTALIRLLLFSSVGLYAQPHLLWTAAALLPFAGLGYAIGSRLHRRWPAERTLQAVWAVLIVGGASLIWRGASGV